jgi:hypothetical protein
MSDKVVKKWVKKNEPYIMYSREDLEDVGRACREQAVKDFYQYICKTPETALDVIYETYIKELGVKDGS